MLLKWIDQNAKSPATKDIGAALQKAAPGPDRAQVLTDAASKLDIFSCGNAKTLATPAPPPPTGAPTVRLFTDAQIIGNAKDADLKKALAAVTPDLVACYTDGITRHPDLAGKLLVKMEFDGDGKVIRATPAEDSTLPDMQTSACIVNKLRSMKLAVSGPLGPGALAARADAPGPVAVPRASPSCSGVRPQLRERRGEQLLGVAEVDLRQHVGRQVDRADRPVALDGRHVGEVPVRRLEEAPVRAGRTRWRRASVGAGPLPPEPSVMRS